MLCPTQEENSLSRTSQTGGSGHGVGGYKVTNSSLQNQKQSCVRNSTEKNGI